MIGSQLVLEYLYVNIVFVISIQLIMFVVRNNLPPHDKNEHVALHLFALFHPRDYLIVP